MKRANIILDGGVTGYGKSEWAKNFVKGFNKVIVLDGLMEYKALQFDSLVKLIDHIEAFNVYRVAYPNIKDFPVLCHIVSKIPDVLFVIEEAQRVIPPRKPLPEQFEDLVFRGRHFSVNILMVSQRFASINIDARSQWTRLICFHNHEPQDLKWIRETSGQPRDFESKISSLPYYHFFDITSEGVALKGPSGAPVGLSENPEEKKG